MSHSKSQFKKSDATFFSFLKMSENPPFLKDSHQVRVYPTNYAGSESSQSESEAELFVEEDERQEGLINVDERLVQNQEVMDEFIASPTWVLERQQWKTTDGSDVILIRKPTASSLSNRLLNPYLYRNVQNVGEMDHLASILDAPTNWEEMYNRVVGDGMILQYLTYFRNLHITTPESDIQVEFVRLVGVISHILGIPICARSETKIIVGGILARYPYDLRASTDPSFTNLNGQYLLASEVKTDISYAENHTWYYGCRGVQVFSTMFAFNCPVFLLTPTRWKLLVENKARNGVLTFPYGDDPNVAAHWNSCLVKMMGTTFLKAIVICLLSRKPNLNPPLMEDTVQETVHVHSSPTKATPVPPGSSQKPPKRRSIRREIVASSVPTPSFISGHVNGQPVYSAIRIVPPEMVATIEEEITKQERKGYKRQESESTLTNA
jgi:hypothetical protein